MASPESQTERPQVPPVVYPEFASQFGLSGETVAKVSCSPETGVGAGDIVIERAIPAGVFEVAVIEALRQMQCTDCRKAKCTYRYPNRFTLTVPE